MILAIDVGNSNIVLGGYESGKICFTSRISSSRNLEADQWAITLRNVLQLHGAQDKPIDGAAISSVVPTLTTLLVQALAHFCDTTPLVFSLPQAEKLGIHVDIENPPELGNDILAGAVAVRHHFSLPAIVIDMGTATKLTALNEQGDVLGVSIAPGLFVSLDALVGNASLLRGVALDSPSPVAIGRNTRQSMQSGMLLGTASLLDGLINRFELEMGPVKTLIATGGAAPVVLPHCLHKIHFSDTLILDGLLLAYQATR